MQIWTFYVEAFDSYRLADIQTDGYIPLKLYTAPLRGWSYGKMKVVILTLTMIMMCSTHSVSVVTD